ncbi:MAG: alkaline phosphatase, partial [Mesotoga sp.]
MKKILTSFFFILFLSSVFLSMEASGPENIVILICDGMGFNHLYISELVTGEAMGSHSPVVSIGRNEALDNLVTDSAAAATAIFSGVKTITGYLGVNALGEEVNTLADILKEQGWWLGLITNTRYYDATPAALYAHAQRRETEVITDFLMESPLDLFYAGGLEQLGINPFTQKPTPRSRIHEL